MQTLRSTPLSTRFNVACFGAFGYELDLGELSYIEKKQVKEQIAFYKEHRKTLQFGDFYRYDSLPLNREAFSVAEKDGSAAVLSLVQTQAIAAPENELIKVKGLLPNLLSKAQAQGEHPASAAYYMFSHSSARRRLCSHGKQGLRAHRRT